MKTITILCIAGALAAGAYAEKAAETRPVSLALSVIGGVDISHISADSTMGVFFDPIGESKNLVWPTVGVAVDLNIGSVFGVSAGVAYDRRGQYIEPTQVQFRDDPFIHDFEARTVLAYVSLPLTFKAGYSYGRQWARARLGLVPAVLVADSLVWFIDGVPSTESGSAPVLEADMIDVRLQVGLEYGVAFGEGRNGIFIGVDYQHGLRTLSYGLPGVAETRAISVFLGYRRYIYGRMNPR